MKTTIYTTPELQYTLTDPMSRQHVVVNSILQAVSYCRMNGLIYSLGF